MDSDVEAQYDSIIIGAGLYGIAAANACLSLDPHQRLVILESRSCAGGVWSHERVYEQFWTQTPINMARFSSLPIQPPPKHDTYFDYFPAKYVATYLSEYVDQQIYCGRSLRQRIVFHSRVTKIELSEARRQWQVFCDGRTEPLLSKTLLVAAGLTSHPNMPNLPGRDAFQGTIIHHLDFAKSPILKDRETKHVAVLGGAKSAADVAYAAAKAGKTVSWIIRRNGSGPAHFAPASGVGPYKNSNESLYSRLAASLSPSIWNHQKWLPGFLHGTKIGRRAIDWIWATLDSDLRREADYHGRGDDASKNGFANLEPDTSFFWQNDSTGINQRPDFWATVATKVRVYRGDLVRLTGKNIVLQTDEVEKVDYVVCATGWRPSCETFFAEGFAHDLGLSVPIGSALKDSQSSYWKRKDAAAEREIDQRFPGLLHPPFHHTTQSTDLSPYRLYRHMIPPNVEEYPGIVFLGHVAVGNNFRAAEVQALWAVAYLAGIMKLPGRAQMETEVARQLAWCRKRYLSKGRLGHWLYYDLVPYTDTLLEDVGLHSHRRKGWWGDLWRPCVAEDLRDLLDELGGKRRKRAAR